MYTQKTFDFLKTLSQNNNRDWFNANKQKYEDIIRTPTLKFIEAMGKLMPQISHEFTAIPKKIGGSMMRPYRDIRFSKDKTPYKTNIGVQFRHQLGKDVHAPGIYLHITTEESFIGLGIWRPDSGSLKRIRNYMLDNPNYWKSIKEQITSQGVFNFAGDKLIRHPQGFDKNHPLIEDLKYKDFIVSRQLSQQEILKQNFPEVSLKHLLQAKNYLEWLCDAVEVSF